MKNVGARAGRVTPAPNSALKDLKHTLPLVTYAWSRKVTHGHFTRESSWGRARENHHFTREDTKSADQRLTFQDGGIESVFQLQSI